VVFPLYDDNPFKLPVRPYVTWGLIVTNIVIFLAVLGIPDGQQNAIVNAFAVVPVVLTHPGTWHLNDWPGLTLLTGMFLHAGWEHLLGNMVYLWVFGDDIEEVLGRSRFIAFYLLAGVASALAYVALNPNSPVPLLGASGAISGVLAAYLMLRPCAKVTVFIFRVVVRIRAYWVIGGWGVLQLVMLASKPDDGVAYLAHVGGLVAGALLFVAMRPVGVRLFECMSREAAPFAGLDGRQEA
jgi:membrane associated rhomboid family serine protease